MYTKYIYYESLSSDMIKTTGFSKIKNFYVIKWYAEKHVKSTLDGVVYSNK